MPFARMRAYSRIIIAAYLVFSLGLLATCLLVARQAGGVMEISEDLYAHPFAVSNAALEAKIAAASIRDGIVYAVLSRNVDEVREAARNAEAQDERFERNMATVAALYLGDKAEARSATALYRTWREVRTGILATAERGEFDQARAMVLDFGSPAYFELRRTLDGITDFARAKAAFLIDQGRSRSRLIGLAIYTTLGLGFVASFACGLLLMRHVQRLVRANEELLTHKASHDPLTGLPNRALFLDRLDHSLAIARRQGTRVAVIYIDLDGFKGVNDSMGHEAGDELLIRVAGRLTSALRRSDTVARLGGDEFAVVISDALGRAEAEAVAAKLVEALGAPMGILDRELTVRGSAGVAIFPDEAEDLASLVSKADAAMYRDKQRHSRRRKRRLSATA